jgi:hypothetical protein
MRLIVLVLLAGCGGSTAAGETIRRQFHALTDQQRPSFEAPGDAVTLSPTPDSGGAIVPDPTCDKSSCVPR